MVKDNGYAVVTPLGRIGITVGRTETGRIRVLTASGTRAYLEKSLHHATIREARDLGFYGTGCKYVEEDPQ